MKTYEFEFNCGKDVAVEEILKNVRKRNFIENPVVYGRASRDKSHIYLYHGNTNYRSSFRPIFSAEVIEESVNKTVVKGYWRLSISTIIFSVCWFAMLIWIGIMPIISGETNNIGELYIFLLSLALFYCGMCAVGVRIEKKRMQKVIDHIKMHQNIINNK